MVVVIKFVYKLTKSAENCETLRMVNKILVVVELLAYFHASPLFCNSF